jgi:hypothetical protein
VENANPEQTVIDLSKKKWRWMAERDVDTLDALFDEKAVFVHMGGSWGKERELDIIKAVGFTTKRQISTRCRSISLARRPSC